MTNTEYTHHCKNGLVITLVDVPAYHPNKPKYCPCCAKTPIVDNSEGYDYYALRLNVPRKLAYHLLITMPRKLNLTRELPARQFSPPRYTKGAINDGQFLCNMTNDELAEYSMHKMPQHLTNGTATLNSHCTKCGSTFVFKVSSPDNPQNSTLQSNHKPLIYCPYCSTPTLIITYEPYSAWQALAEVYNMPVIGVKAYFKFWQQYSKLPTFAEFMASAPARIEQELKSPLTRNKTVPIRKTIRLRVKQSSAIPHYAEPKPPTTPFIPQPPLTHHLCQSCHECELSNPDQSTCETCKINSLNHNTEFNSNGGC